jgi:hypothetical protein
MKIYSSKKAHIMKNQTLHLNIWLLTLVLLAACGGSGKRMTTNEYLGKWPSMEAQYHNGISAMKKELKECTDLEKAFKLDKEMKQKKEEMEQEIDDYLSRNPIKEPLPFEPLHETPYTIGEIALVKTQANSLKLDFPISIDEDIEGTHRLTLYFKALDQEGNDIEDSKSVAGGMGRPSLKAGSTFVVSGYWQNKTLRNMADFAKIVEISREEYNRK